MVPGGDRYAARVPANTAIFLDFLDRHAAKCTFFTVGSVMCSHPELVQEIAARGHEIACHTDRHLQLDKLGVDGLRRDLDAWLAEAARLQLPIAKGFRAPTFSLMERTSWTHAVLKEHGFTYSSSVLPADNPLYGWPDFGQVPRVVDGVLEIPMNLSAVGPLRVPFGGGVYFRVLPWLLVRGLFRQCAKEGRPVLGYFHPYDVDTLQERFMHPDLNGSRLLNALMYLGRQHTVKRLDAVMAMGFRIGRYDTYAQNLLAHAQ